jgi:hypothetical protein
VSLNPARNVFTAIWKFKKGVELQVAICVHVVVTTAVRQNGSVNRIVTMSQALLKSFLQLKQHPGCSSYE